MDHTLDRAATFPSFQRAFRAMSEVMQQQKVSRTP
jgi:hypothetical protein